MSEQPFDPKTVDLEGFLAELDALRADVVADLGEVDIHHVRLIEALGRTATAIGLATCWIAPNPLSATALSLGRSARWIMMHHVGHRGYDRVPNIPRRFHSKVFAMGKRRYLDWFDWMLPDAWNYEHNVLHHGNTGEERDPDLIERNSEYLRQSKLPMPLKYGAMGFLSLTWRFFYYAPNTLRAYMQKDSKQPLADGQEPAGYKRRLWLECYLPYGAAQFVGLPLCYSLLGPWAVGSAFLNSVMAEAITNVHTFLVIGPNHSGDDVYRFDSRPASRAEVMLRQVIGSVNYATGTELIDSLHLYLNYQIEHHLFPELPMGRYRELQPKVKALCEKYGVPYVQESVFTRAKKMVDVAVGKTSMKRFSGLRARVGASIVGQVASGLGHAASGLGHAASGLGHAASGLGHAASGPVLSGAAPSRKAVSVTG